ncbi:MAG: PPOX class F420-dependent oxidoreductase [Chloroflexota bacterium]
MSALSPGVRALFEGPNFGTIATVMADGSPQVSAMWVDTDGEFVLLNTALGRTKAKNIERDPRVAVSVIDKDNGYRQVTVRGQIVEVSREGADAHIDKLAKKYLGLDSYPYRNAAEQRVILKIRPDRVTRMNVED